MRTVKATMLALASLSAACHCPQAVETDTDPSTSTSDSSTGASSHGSETSEGGTGTGEPFDALRWIGRYHYEDTALSFGEVGDPYGPPMLVNFEIFPSSRATMVYDHCSFDEPIVIDYAWEPDEDGWLRLLPGEGETSLRVLAAENLKALRVRRVVPVDSCRAQLNFEADGVLDDFHRFHPGESCWVDRCTSPNLMQVDYCDGEEPPPCP
jgi:hypothetical protein